MTQENISALVNFRIEQAESSVRAATLLENEGAMREVIHLSYYAMFYAVLALLAVEQRESSKHQGVISLFDRDYVRKGFFPKDFSKWLHGAFNLRQEADYAPLRCPSKEEAHEVLDNAIRFPRGVKERLEKQLTNSSAQ